MAIHVNIQAARQLIATTWPYFSAAAFRLIPRETQHPALPTLAVDPYWRLYYNREWVEAQPVGRLALAIAGHELQHLLFRHFRRAESIERNPDVINICQDFAINCDIAKFAAAGLAYRQRRNGAAVEIVADPLWAYPDKAPAAVGGPFENGLLFEDYLAKFKEPPGQGGGQGQSGQGQGVAGGACGSGAHGRPMPYDEPPPAPGSAHGVTEAEARVIARGVAEAVREHAEKYPGTLPGGLLSWVEYELSPPRVPWEQQLKAELRKSLNWVAGRVDRTYSRRSSRQPCRARRVAAGRNFIRPGLHAPKPRFVVVLDTSGSMGHDDYQAALSEIQALARMGGTAGVPVLCCDAAVSEVRLFKDCSRVALEGGGGTDMGVGIARAAELGYPVVVVLTDSYTPWPEQPPPNTKVVVGVTNPVDENFQPPAWAAVLHCYDE